MTPYGTLHFPPLKNLIYITLLLMFNELYNLYLVQHIYLFSSIVLINDIFTLEAS